MQVAMNMCFLLNPEKKARIYLIIFEEKTKKSHTLISKNDVTEPKASLFDGFLEHGFRKPETETYPCRVHCCVLG